MSPIKSGRKCRSLPPSWTTLKRTCSPT
ncbi:UNVERIFIED_ORG: hypothetical protein GGD59_004841 [Rhizobium esperanzae]